MDLLQPGQAMSDEAVAALVGLIVGSYRGLREEDELEHEPALKATIRAVSMMVNAGETLGALKPEPKKPDPPGPTPLKEQRRG